MTKVIKNGHQLLYRTLLVINNKVMRNIMSSRIEEVVVTEPTSGKHTGTVFFLHGSGGTGPSIKKWVEMYRHQAAFPHLKIKYPTAVKRPYTPLNGQESNVWFNRLQVSPFCPEHIETINPMCKELKKLIEDEVESGIPIDRIIVGGFSMGGAMAMHVGYRILPNVAGVFALSSFLNENSITYKELEEKKYDKLPPIFCAHGETDDLVHVEWGQDTFKRLQEFGANGVFHVLHNAFHQLTKKELDLLFDWINKILPNTNNNRNQY